MERSWVGKCRNSVVLCVEGKKDGTESQTLHTKREGELLEVKGVKALPY